MQLNDFNYLPREYYTRVDVLQIARDLLGKVLYTNFNNKITAGIIIETEAYAGVSDRASHAYKNRRTNRNEIMYMEGGYAYVYLCYGIHSLFNIVTSTFSDPQAVLIRAIKPLHGINHMKKRIGMSVLEDKNGIGPGKVTKLLGIQVGHTGTNLCFNNQNELQIWLQDENIKVLDSQVIIGPRIGVGYAGEDAFLPFRFQWIKKAP